MPVTVADYRKALGQFATGVTVITVEREAGLVHGMTANAFCSLSLEPLQILVCVDRKARTHGLLQARGRFGVNILRESQEPWAHYFAQTELDQESAKRLGVVYRTSGRGTPLLEGALVELDCLLAGAYDGGDHTIFLGAVEEALIHEGRPLLFHGGKFARLHAAD